MGTSGSSWSAADIETWSQGSGIPKESIDNFAKELYKSAYYTAKTEGKGWASANTEAFKRFQEVLGLNAKDVNTKKLLDSLYGRLGTDPKKWPVDPVVSDLITSDLFSQIRTELAGLELGESLT